MTRRGFLRSGGEMLLVGSLAALVASAIGALVAGLNGDEGGVVFRSQLGVRADAAGAAGGEDELNRKEEQCTCRS